MVKLICLWIFLLSFLLLAVAGGAQVKLVENNTAKAVIVVPNISVPSVAYAAQELQYHIQEATGSELEIIPESKWNKTGSAVFLGDTVETFRAGVFTRGLPPNGFIVRTIGNRLYVAGDDSDGAVFGPYRIQHNNLTHVGTLLGVYELLRNQLEVKWLWPGKLGEVIPKRKSITIGELNVKSAPKLIHTRVRDGGPAIANEKGWTSVAEYVRYTTEQSKWLRRQGLAMAFNMDLTHSYVDWWERFSATHPEYFNLLPDGTRCSDPYYWGGNPTLISMCVSEPGLWKQKVEDWKNNRSPLRPYLDASENDTNGVCTCERCMSWDVPNGKLDFPFDQRLAKAKELFSKGDATWVKALGNVSNRYARYCLEVQKEARKVDKDAVVMSFAYANYTVPPVKTKLNNNIITAIVPGMMFPWTKEKIAAFHKQWQGWSDTGCRLMLRPNYTLDGANMPIFYARKLGNALNFAGKNGMIATDFDSLTGQWATQGPNLYVLLRMQYDPELNVNKVLDEYYSGFGPAAKAVKEYFGYWERISDAITDKEYSKVREEKKGDWARFVRMAGVFFTPEVMEKGTALLDKAAKAASGDADAEKRVEFLSRGLQQAKLCLAVQDEFEKYKSTAVIEPYRQALKKLDDFRDANESWNISNMQFLKYFESQTWDRTFVKEMDAPGIEIGGTWKFAWDPEDVGEKENWQADILDTSNWLDIIVGVAWEDHSVGKEWQEEHGKPYDGIAWYRKEFTVTPEQAAKDIKILFGAVDEACKVYVNGKLLLDRPYPYQGNLNSWQEAFSVDIKQVLRTDKPNSLAVRVEDSAGAGGIWRPVWIIAKD